MAAAASSVLLAATGIVLAVVAAELAARSYETVAQQDLANNDSSYVALQLSWAMQQYAPAILLGAIFAAVTAVVLGGLRMRLASRA